MNLERYNTLTPETCRALCEEAKGGSLLGVRFGDDFAETIEKLGPPDDVTSPHHVRYGGLVEIAADPEGRISLLYAELPEDLCIAAGLITDKLFATNSVAFVRHARFVHDSDCQTMSVDVFRPAEPVVDEPDLEHDSNIPNFLRDQDAWLTLCREMLQGSAFGLRLGDAIDQDHVARLLGTPVVYDGYTITIGPIDIDIPDGRIDEIIVRVPRAARVLPSDLGVVCELGDGTVRVISGSAELAISQSGRVFQLHLLK